jgi:hypothetical protein
MHVKNYMCTTFTQDMKARERRRGMCATLIFQPQFLVEFVSVSVAWGGKMGEREREPFFCPASPGRDNFLKLRYEKQSEKQNNISHISFSLPRSLLLSLTV